MRRAAALIAAAAILLTPIPARRRAWRIVRISRVVADLAVAEAFYRDALGFTAVARGEVDAATLAVLAAGAASQVTMRLGGQEIALVRFDSPGLPYPRDARSNDGAFQHLAIVVADMDAAYAHLCKQAGWQPISEGGPVLLPPSNGGVRAFKFRDPDGHPLELIWFPPGSRRWDGQDGPFKGIDHSALVVSSTSRSAGFYRALGFRVGARSLNHGAAQARLDGLPGAWVRVTGLRPAADGSAGLELLDYRPVGRRAGANLSCDGITDWVTVDLVRPDGGKRVWTMHSLRDPDGHLLLVAGSR